MMPQNHPRQQLPSRRVKLFCQRSQLATLDSSKVRSLVLFLSSDTYGHPFKLSSFPPVDSGDYHYERLQTLRDKLTHVYTHTHTSHAHTQRHGYTHSLKICTLPPTPKLTLSENTANLYTAWHQWRIHKMVSLFPEL